MRNKLNLIVAAGAAAFIGTSSSASAQAGSLFKINQKLDQALANQAALADAPGEAERITVRLRDNGARTGTTVGYAVPQGKIFVIEYVSVQASNTSGPDFTEARAALAADFPAPEGETSLSTFTTLGDFSRPSFDVVSSAGFATSINAVGDVFVRVFTDTTGEVSAFAFIHGRLVDVE